MGHYFLRHIERNSTLLFLIPADADDIKKQYDILLDELRRYNPDTKAYIINNFGSIKITLGVFQKLVRGDKELPIWGLPDVITAMSSRPYKDGKHKVTQGESYIGLVRFNENGPILESIISFGNSDNPDSEHYTDQMEKYSKFQTKKMTFDKNIIYSQAKKIYNPN